ncbi:MAG: arginine repressor [Clostridium sp.]|nr:arginine repressor [Clostridium sp.]MCM1547366.1 arginine repressor [Ruminococcus sp.]
MKNKRQYKILDIIKLHDVETQEMLQGLLSEYGFKVTQATVSRDIKELKLVKKMNKNGIYRYEAPVENQFKQNIFADTVTSIDYAVNTVVIKCHNGMAQAACAALDSMNYGGIVGTIAGDDTIFVLMRTEAEAKKLVKTFKELVWG